MTKKIGKTRLPEWLAYPMLLALFAAAAVCGLIVGVGVQVACFILQPIPSLKKPWEALIDIIHDQRN